ncbi:lolT-1 [Nannizzia gypsea CBS 118893]|uniref:LolT-1 n=1 Tax=Arthroderma gypseum (strain ATCC MYA-4604 / CBS 118893) TaxID=535722 RepID=E4V6U8_ARTGP|nr:lolT-1 [Nannizzia gypsea CBS 118893]EFQ96814.1 lolT-1 [Nannizzia gypsea CBS 118893]
MGSIEPPRSRYERTPFGHEMLKHFSIDPTYTELNNGSFGTVPTAILNKAHELRRRCEGRPCSFSRYEFPAWLDKSREAVADLLNGDPDNIVLVANGSTASNTIMRNFAWNEDGLDEIIQVSIIFAPLGKMTGYVGRVDPKLAQALASGKTPFVYTLNSSLPWTLRLPLHSRVDPLAPGGSLMADILGTKVLDNKSQTVSACCMTNVLLPLKLDAGNNTENPLPEGWYAVRSKPGVQFRVSDWIMRKMATEYETLMPVFFFQGSWWARGSAQVYLELNDFDWAGRMLKDLCERVGDGEYLL